MNMIILALSQRKWTKDLFCCLFCPYNNNNNDYYHKMIECNISDYANNKCERNPSTLHAHKQQNKFSCMHVEQQFIPFLFQTGLEGKLVQQNDSWICKLSVSVIHICQAACLLQW